MFGRRDMLDDHGKKEFSHCFYVTFSLCCMSQTCVYKDGSLPDLWETVKQLSIHFSLNCTCTKKIDHRENTHFLQYERHPVQP